ncbi:MAG: response regulator transcription factor [Holophagaceae bacterium]|nr:response regulator transcription factor [Holophagaceae bacterium]
MTLKVALADDEPLARTRLGRLLREAGCEVLAELPDGPSLLEWLRSAPPLDGLFLDIQMPGATGLEVVAELPAPVPVVFVTAYSEHAVRAFDTQAVDYILKPIAADRLQRALERLREGRVPHRSGAELQAVLAPSTPAGATRFPVRAGDGHVFLDLKKTTHFDVEDEMVWAHAQGSGKLQRFRTQWTTLAEVEHAFPAAGLMRIQRHLLLRPEAVLGLKPIEGGRALVRVADGVDLEVSRSVTPKLKELLGL